MIKKLYITLASFCVALGVAGIFIPILPTTPFLLAAIYLYMRSSKSGVKMILRNKYLAPYVSSYFSKRGIPLPILLRTLVLLWLTLGISFILVKDHLHVELILLIVGIGVTVHLFLKRSKGFRSGRS